MKKQTKKTVIFLLLLVGFFSTSKAIGQGCETLLMNGVFNTFNYNSGEYSSAEWHNFWCNGTVEKTNSKSQTNGALNVGVKVVTLGMSFDDAQEFQKIYKSINCGANNGDKLDISTKSVIQKVASPEILKAYVDCKKLQSSGLIVDLSLREDDKKVFVVNVKYTGAWQKGAAPKVKKVVFLPNVISTKEGTLKDGVELTSGQTFSMICERSAEYPVTVFVETEVGTFHADLSATIPPPTDQEKIMNSMPKGTILGWFNSINIPKGWAICDGNNGTPDLNERTPIGTVTGNLGDRVGKVNHNHNIKGGTSTPSFGNYDGQDIGPLQKLGNERIMHNHTMDFTSGDADNLPPSTKIFFIMKL